MSMQEKENAAAEEAAREHDIALGNPLLNPRSDFNVKRRYVWVVWMCREVSSCRVAYRMFRWDDDVIFKNQARGTEDKRKKEFVNVKFLPGDQAGEIG
jgi:protein CWC15